MHLHWLIFFLVTLRWVCDAKYCSFTQYAKAKKDLFEHLGLDKNDFQNTRMWPLIFNNYYENNYTEFSPTNNTEINPADNTEFKPAYIYVDLYVTSIINVDEKAQSLTTQVKTITAWPNLKMWWRTEDFCGITKFVAPRNMFWTPDIGIMESIKTEFGTKESPNVMLFNFGYAVSFEMLSLTTACKMDLHRFPFDTQSCNITLQSTSYSNHDIALDLLTNKWNITSESKKFQAQGEWELLEINYTKATLAKWIEVDQLIYQITIKRRPQLYVINIIVPVFFFLLLDVASFFIDTKEEDKLNFKVTLLLSISVMLLILNDTLPSTAENLPLIGVYCCAIFCLIGISIVETIFVNFLKTKAAEKRSVETTAAVTVTGRDDLASTPDSVKDQNDKHSCTIDLLKQILTEVQAATQQNQRKKTSLCWTRVARIIDVTFLVLYIITIIVFLSVLGKLWLP
ncbi:5-hydroxytryptamine receptor 3A-like [Megalobrama amblycephala]|uniref:5-hydroxytryptamine receptor 3A-like n=1 Tax=Megalobrama amblycephala TaxID=75352 RepID=UPI0020140E49|nr:5-hydroxytryptamine receptor 3A-like [Megalobrama amblycephala]